MNIDKHKNFSEWFNTVISDAELADLRYNVKGFVVFRPWSVKTMKLMYAAYEEVLERNNHSPALFPALIPESSFKVEGEHVEGFTPQVFWVEQAGGNKLEERLAMRPTSETAMYQMYAIWIQGLADLPVKIYQSCQVWRYETKATKPFFRSREFYWIEAHNAFATEEEAVAQVTEDMEMAEEVLTSQLGIPFIFFQRPEWDKFPGAVHTFAADTLMPDGKVLQLPSTHLLGQNFAKAFNVAFQNEKGERAYVWQTCYGPAISRIYGALFSIHGDNKGLIMPFDFAPIQVIVIPILSKNSDSKAIEKYANEICGTLAKSAIRAKVDSSPSTPGFKYNHWELRGVPLRIEVGAREEAAKSLTIARRDNGKKETVDAASAIEAVNKAGKEVDSEIFARANSFFSASQSKASTMDELKAAIDAGGIVRVPYCTMEKEGKPCADEIKARAVGDVRGIIYPHEPAPTGEKCVFCGKSAKHYAYVARQY